MRLSVRTLDGIAIVSVAGTIDSRTAGQLSDALVDCIGKGGTKLIVELSGVHIMTHAGVRGLVVAARLMQTIEGSLRICGALTAVEIYLKSLGFNHLLKCDPTLQASLARLRDGGSREAGTATPALRVPAPAYAAAL